MHSITELVNRRYTQYGGKFDASDLDKRFIQYYQSGQRIKVETYGRILTGTVGVTAGWKPVFLLMRTSRSLSSPWLLGKECKLLAIKQGKKYMPVNNK